MKFDLNDYVQREHHYCIVDEVDSILIDEAVLPCLFPDLLKVILLFIKSWIRLFLSLIKKPIIQWMRSARSSVLTEAGILKIQEILKISNLYDMRNIEILHHVNQSLKAILSLRMKWIMLFVKVRSLSLMNLPED